MTAEADPLQADDADAAVDPGRLGDIREIHAALREHELELNRATAAFEHASVAPLIIVNGGAAAAWLTFLGSGARSDGAPGVALFWVIGLTLTVYASYIGWRRQQSYARAERLRREAWELLWLAPRAPQWRSLQEVATSIAYDARTWAEPYAPWQQARLDAASHHAAGKDQGETFVWAIRGATLAFIIGAVWAAFVLS